jgi:hypothetical protein
MLGGHKIKICNLLRVKHIPYFIIYTKCGKNMITLIYSNLLLMQCSMDFLLQLTEEFH